MRISRHSRSNAAPSSYSVVATFRYMFSSVIRPEQLHFRSRDAGAGVSHAIARSYSIKALVRRAFLFPSWLPASDFPIRHAENCSSELTATATVSERAFAISEKDRRPERKAGKDDKGKVMFCRDRKEGREGGIGAKSGPGRRVVRYLPPERVLPPMLAGELREKAPEVITIRPSLVPVERRSRPVLPRLPYRASRRTPSCARRKTRGDRGQGGERPMKPPFCRQPNVLEELIIVMR